MRLKKEAAVVALLRGLGAPVTSKHNNGNAPVPAVKKSHATSRSSRNFQDTEKQQDQEPHWHVTF